MMIRERDHFVELRCLETLPASSSDAGDMRLVVRVDSYGFTGRSGGIWIDAPNYGLFLKHVRDLASKGVGSAELEAANPSELRLRIRATNSGSLVLDGKMGRWVDGILDDGPILHSVEFGFALSPTCLPQMLIDFAALPGS